MSKNAVKYISNAIKVSRKINSVIDTALKKMLLNSQRSVVQSFTRNFNAKDPSINSPRRNLIDSGQLRTSINQKQTSKNEGEVFTNKHYAAHVEFGTVKMKARPYFRKGMADSEAKNRNILRYDLIRKVK